jgi:hypothetical protein
LTSCDTATGVDTKCTDELFLNSTLVNGTSPFVNSPKVGGVTATFTTAFSAWDQANIKAGGAAWTLAYGGYLPISTSAHVWTNASVYGAGLGSVIFTVNGSSQLLSALVWTQALIINYSTLTGPLSTPIETLDTFSLSQNAAGSNPNFPKTCAAASSGASPSGGAFCGPIYPFQYATEYQNYSLDGVRLGVDPFYDAPEGDWPNASFDAVTLLSFVSQATHTLTVYEGWSYGFALNAIGQSTSAALLRSRVLSATIPEPSTWAMMVLGFAGLGFAGYRRARSERQAAPAT